MILFNNSSNKLRVIGNLGILLLYTEHQTQPPGGCETSDLSYDTAPYIIVRHCNLGIGVLRYDDEFSTVNTCESTNSLQQV
jgi:hypothetical protein